MHEVFSDPVAVTVDFLSSSAYFAAIVFCGALVLWVADRKKPVAMPKAVFVIVSGILIVFGASIIASSTVCRFYELTFAKNELVLKYPLSRTYNIHAKDLNGARVLFGLSGKRITDPVSCYVAIHLPKGNSYRSAPRPAGLAACKALASSISAAISAHGTGT